MLGVKPEWRASAIGVDDRAFLEELEGAVGQLSVGRILKGADAIFFGATKEAELTRLPRLKASLKPNGALWVVRPKGRPEISERAVMAAGKAAGLVDVKVVSFSPTHTAEKFVIPIAGRRSVWQPREGYGGPPIRLRQGHGGISPKLQRRWTSCGGGSRTPLPITRSPDYPITKCRLT